MENIVYVSLWPDRNTTPYDTHCISWLETTAGIACVHKWELCNLNCPHFKNSLRIQI